MYNTRQYNPIYILSYIFANENPNDNIWKYIISEISIIYFIYIKYSIYTYYNI